MRLFGRRSLPEQPPKGSNKLQASRHPKRRLHATTAATQPTTNDSTNKQSHNPAHATIALHISSRLIGDFRIRRDVKVDTSQNHGWDFVVAERATARHAARRLESQQTDRDQLEEQGASVQGGVGGSVGDEIGFDESDGDDDEKHLDEEGDEEGSSAEGADAAHGDGEDHGAEEEGQDGDQGLQPAPWLAGWLVGGSEAEEDGVSWVGLALRGFAPCGGDRTGLHAQEAGPGIVGAAVA